MAVRFTQRDAKFIRQFQSISHSYANLVRKLLPLTVYNDAEGRAAKARLSREARATSKKLNALTRPWLLASSSAEAVNAVIRAGKELTAELKGLAIEGINVKNFGTVNQKTLSALQASARGEMVPALNSMGQVMRKAVRKAQLTVAKDAALRRAVAEGVKEGEPFKVLSKRVLNATGLKDGDRVVLTSGRTYDAKAYSELIARTVPGDIGNEVHAAELVGRGVRHFKIPGFAGVEPTDYCFVAQGKVWAPRPKDPLGFPVPPKRKKRGKRWPKYHPNCAHNRAPWIPAAHTKAQIQKEKNKHRVDASQMAKVKN